MHFQEKKGLINFKITSFTFYILNNTAVEIKRKNLWTLLLKHKAKC